MSNQTQHCETSQSAVRGGALQRGATIDFAYYTWWRWDLGWSAVTQYADSDTDWTVEGFERFFVPYGHAALAEADVTTTPANAAYNYLAQDHLGTGRFVYDQAKAETAAVEHLPYGDRYAATGDAPYHEFTGKPWDDDAGLFYFPYRYYAPTIARWTTPDPAGLVDGPQVYSYVRNNPIGFSDRLGLWLWRTLIKCTLISETADTRTYRCLYSEDYLDWGAFSTCAQHCYDVSWMEGFPAGIAGYCIPEFGAIELALYADCLERCVDTYLYQRRYYNLIKICRKTWFGFWRCKLQS
jgi:RHS repeat-associated protein